MRYFDCHRLTPILMGVLLAASMAWAADQPASRPAPPEQSQWEKDIANSYEAYRLLFQSAPAGNSGSEVMQWEARALKENPRRLGDLERLLKDYPDSPFADDAALLLARAQFLYKGDSNAAIAGLYAVAKDYAAGVWFAGDPLVLEWLVPLARAMKPYQDDSGKLRLKVIEDERTAEENKGANRSELSKVISYLDYLQNHSNRTADEAKYWIAWIIVQAKLEDRYAEAEGLLRGLAQQYRDHDRTQQDLAAAKELGNPLVASLPRTEQNASATLVELLERTGKKKEALTVTEPPGA